MALHKLKELVDSLPPTSLSKRRIQFEVWQGENTLVCYGSYRPWVSNERRDFLAFSTIALEHGYEVTTWIQEN